MKYYMKHYKRKSEERYTKPVVKKLYSKWEKRNTKRIKIKDDGKIERLEGRVSNYER